MAHSPNRVHKTQDWPAIRGKNGIKPYDEAPTKTRILARTGA
jgi:hypothetical protein